MRRITLAEQEAEREAFEARDRKLQKRAAYWLGFTVGSAVGGFVQIALDWWLS